VLVLEIQKKTLFMKMKDVYPECEYLIADQPQLFPFRCLRDSCPRNANCMGKLAVRVKYIFDTFKEAELVVLYFKYRDRPQSQRAGIFWKDMREPRYITMNLYSWAKLKELGTVYEWEIPDDVFLGTRDKISVPSRDS
jgi:hypothetical protein